MPASQALDPSPSVPAALERAGARALFAAEQGNARAQYNLGVMYANGTGVPEDYVQAYAWVNLAAAQGNKKAVEGKELLRSGMTAEQVAKAQKLAAEMWDRIESSKSQ